MAGVVALLADLALDELLGLADVGVDVFEMIFDAELAAAEAAATLNADFAQAGFEELALEEEMSSLAEFDSEDMVLRSGSRIPFGDYQFNALPPTLEAETSFTTAPLGEEALESFGPSLPYGAPVGRNIGVLLPLTAGVFGAAAVGVILHYINKNQSSSSNAINPANLPNLLWDYNLATLSFFRRPLACTSAIPLIRHGYKGLIGCGLKRRRRIKPRITKRRKVIKPRKIKKKQPKSKVRKIKFQNVKRKMQTRKRSLRK